MTVKRPTPVNQAMAQCVIDYCAGWFGVTPAAIVSASGDAVVIKARFASAWVIRTVLNLPHAQAGYVLGLRDHTTISDAVRRAPDKVGYGHLRVIVLGLAGYVAWEQDRRFR